MQDRSARIRYQDIATNSSPPVRAATGSPVSPILFLLYTEPIYRLGSSKGRFGYADDTAILCVGDSLDETSAEASHHVRELVSWGAANGISFDPEKTEVMHFSRTTPKTAPPVLHGEFEKRPGRAMRWLGVWLDSTLSFKTHVEKWTAKAQAVAFHLRRLTNTRHGPLPSAVRRAVCACVIPVLLYAAEVWYPGSTRPRWTKPGKEGPSRIGHLVKKMSKALYTSLRAILPVWRTTPTNVLHREAGIPPVPLLLEARRTAFAARLKSLDEAHPLVKRTSRPKAPILNEMIKLKYQKQPKPFRTRLRRSDELLPSCPRPALLQRGFVEEQTAPLQSASKNETAKKFRDWLQALSPRTLVVYSDGSRSTEGHAGYGYVVHRDGSTVLRDKGRLGPAEIFDAEAKGNEEADALAKAGASLPEPADNVPTLAHLRKIARQQPEEAFKAWWEASAPERYRDLRLKATTSCPSELALSRPCFAGESELLLRRICPRH
ncbi:reverse transcriptase (RNA-dependent DNA polymerase) [Hirsutella rhossiliensis]